MKKYTYILLVAFLFGSISLITSCAEEIEEEEEVIPEDQLITTATEIKLDLVMGHIPSPTKLTAEIPKTGANYDKSILNPTSKAASYSTNYQQGTKGWSVRTEFNYPLHRLFTKNLELYFFAQRFDGYAESLIDFRDKKHATRFGFSLVR